MKRLAPVLTRLFLITALIGAGYFAYTYFSVSSSTPLYSILSSIKAKTPTIRIDTNRVALKAKEKLVDQQPIIEDSPEQEMKPNVMGATTTAVSSQAKEFISNTSEKITSELKNLPKEQAANIVKQTCDQIISELEK